MTETTATLAAKRAEVALHQERLSNTVSTLKERLTPASLMNDAVDGVKSTAENAVVEARRRPAAAGGVAAATVLILFRKPIGRVIRKLLDRLSGRGNRPDTRPDP